MERRYEAYKTHVVKPFFREHIARLDRQIVLIDAMQALNAGPGAMADLERAVTEILACFRPGRGSFLTDLFSRRIDRILVAATKADHLHHESHDRLQAIVRRLADRAIERADFSGADVDVLAMAAVRATREGTVKQGRETLPVIIGTPLKGETIGGETFDGKTETAIFPGDLPEKIDAISLFEAPTAADARGRSGDPLRALPPAEAGTHRRRRDAVAAAYPARPRAAVPDRRPSGMTAPRKPAAFRIEPEAAAERQAAQPRPRRKPPRALRSRASRSSCRPRSTSSTSPTSSPPNRRRRPRRSGARCSAAIFFGAFGVLVSLAVGLWTDQLIRDLFARAEWLGWLAAGMAAIAALALLVILVREIAGDRAARLGRKAAQARRSTPSRATIRRRREPWSTNCPPSSPAKPETAAGRRALAELRGDIIDGANLVRLAETEILGAARRAGAKLMILDAAKRVSLVTAVSPRALVDVAYVVFEAGAADPPAVRTLRRPAGNAGLLPAGAQRAGASRGHRLDRRRRQFRPADRRPWPGRAAFGEARRRRRQRHDDGAHRHRRDGDGAAPALQRR